MDRMIYAGIAVIILVGLAFLMFRQKPKSEAQSEASPVATSPAAQVAEEPKTDRTMTKPELTIDTTKTYTAKVSTSEGDFMIVLNAGNNPITVNNFVYLARNNYYNDTIFHRVINGFMIQGGDPTGTGAGDPGYKFDDEPFTGEYTRGAVAMANAGPNTNGSQFFIMHADTPLPKNYVIFGYVSQGINIVDKIATAETTVSMGGEKSKPVNPVKINSVDITEE